MATLSLRERKRLSTMRHVQATAIEMFEVDGFDATTVEAVAAAADVSPSTIYRHFGTKEAIVIWDERDRIVDHELGSRLGRQRPVGAFRDAAVVALARRDDLDRFARRLRLMFSEPSIWATAVTQDLRDRSELADAFAMVNGRAEPRLADEVLAGTCLVALDAALERWQQVDCDEDLASLIVEAFAVIGPID